MKIITVSNKETARKDRMSKSEATALVEAGTHHFVKKGSFKRQEKDAAKIANRPARKSIFGAKHRRRYEQAKIA